MNNVISMHEWQQEKLVERLELDGDIISEISISVHHEALELRAPDRIEWAARKAAVDAYMEGMGKNNAISWGRYTVKKLMREEARYLEQEKRLKSGVLAGLLRLVGGRS